MTEFEHQARIDNGHAPREIRGSNEIAFPARTEKQLSFADVFSLSSNGEQQVAQLFGAPKNRTGSDGQADHLIIPPLPQWWQRDNGGQQSRPGPEQRDRVKPQQGDFLKPTEPGSDRQRRIIEVRPGESIQRALDTAPDGATVHVQPGVYRERLRINRDNITLRGDGKAILDLDGKSISNGAIQISDRKNVTIDGFEIRNVRGGETPTGIRVDGASRDISILNNDIHHVEDDGNAHGIAVYGDKGTAINNVKILGNRVHHNRLGQSESVVINGNVNDFKILGNKVHDNDNIGIDIIGGERVGNGNFRPRNGVVGYNDVWNIDSLPNRTYGARTAAGIYVDGASDILIHDNNVRNSNYGIEIASERQGWNAENITVRRNRIEGSHLAGITYGGGEASNGGVVDSVIEDNDLRGNARPLWRQHNTYNVTVRNNRS